MTLQLGRSVLQGQGSLQGWRNRLPTTRQPLRSAARHGAPTRCAAFQPFGSGLASCRQGITSPSLTRRRPLSKQPSEPAPDRHVSQQAELIFDYWCETAVCNSHLVICRL